MAIMTNVQFTRADRTGASEDVLNSLLESLGNANQILEDNLQNALARLDLLGSDEVQTSGFSKNTSKEIIYYLSNDSKDNSGGYIQIKGNNLPTYSASGWTTSNKLPSFTNIAYRNDSMDGLTFDIKGNLSFSNYTYQGEKYQLANIKLSSLSFGDNNLKITVAGNVGIQERGPRPDQDYWPDPLVNGAITSIRVDIKTDNSTYIQGKLDLSISTNGATISALEISETGKKQPLFSAKSLNMRMNKDGEFVDAKGKIISDNVWDAALAGDDRISGTHGDDMLDGGRGNDSIAGSNGNDVIAPGAGRDSLTGGKGNDTFILSKGDYDFTSSKTLFADTITDFKYITNGEQDTITLEGFSSIEAYKTIADAKKAASEAEVIYESSTGRFWYNEDMDTALVGVMNFATAKGVPLSYDWSATGAM